MKKKGWKGVDSFWQQLFQAGVTGGGTRKFFDMMRIHKRYSR